MEIVYYVATSADGFIAREDGAVDWLEPFSSGDHDYGLMSGVFTKINWLVLILAVSEEVLYPTRFRAM